MYIPKLSVMMSRACYSYLLLFPFKWRGIEENKTEQV